MASFQAKSMLKTAMSLSVESLRTDKLFLMVLQLGKLGATRKKPTRKKTFKISQVPFDRHPELAIQDV